MKRKLFFLSLLTLGFLAAQAQRKKAPVHAKAEAAAPVPSDGRISFVIPPFQVIAPNVVPNVSNQMRQVLVSDLLNDGMYHVLATPEGQGLNTTVANDKILKKANYILQGKIVAYDEKETGLGFKSFRANLGKVIHYGFSFEVINAKTSEMVLVKDWDVKVKGGKMGVTTGATGDYGNVNVDADIFTAYEKNLKEVIQYIESQTTKIVMN